MEEAEKELLNSLQDLALTDLDPSLEQVEKIIGYNFTNKCLLQQAFIDPSYLKYSTPSLAKKDLKTYERLEYVGDSVLNFVISTEHYSVYPDLPPGQLTRLRAANVDTEKLARVAVEHKLYKFLRHKRPLFDDQIREFMDAMPKYPLHSYGLIDPPKVLADIVESTIGAVFVDSNFSMEITSKIIKNLVQPMITPETLKTNPATKLHELCQKNGFKVTKVDLWKEKGEVEYYAANEFVGRAKYSPRRLIARNRAAENAYCEILRKLSLDTAKA